MITIDRNQELAKIKSSVELLEECKQKILDNSKLDEKTKKERIQDIDEAIKENYDKARLQYQATKKEVDSAVYNEVSEEYKHKYAERLQKKGLTDEQLHQKEQAVVTVVTAEVDTTTERKRHRKTKRTEQRDDEAGFDASKIERVSNEEELMNKTRVKDKRELERRRHRSTDTMSDVPRYESEDVIGEVIKEKKIKVRNESTTVVEAKGEKEPLNKRENQRVLDKTTEESKDYNFDVSEIPSNIQYDILPLPSNGECYAHKKNRIPVAYLTAADENIIASPNMYRDGKIIDVILERKILDKSINVSELCRGDRDAIVLWLRATGYGVDYPIVATHPETRKQYPVNVKLDTFKYHPFNLKGDENGYFDYTTESGDLLKFKYLSIEEENELRDSIIKHITDIEKYNILKYIRYIKESLSESGLNEGDKKELDDCVEDMKDIINISENDINMDDFYSYNITTQMIKYTKSVNGNSDPEYIKEYIENMRSKDAYGYRSYVNDNAPGVNLKITVNVPQSDGGGTFTTFLGIDEYVFGNI